MFVAVEHDPKLVTRIAVVSDLGHGFRRLQPIRLSHDVQCDLVVVDQFLVDIG
jgi:hypothetical protein